jgi:parvulin-like peptidyl-prolyl isomerase
MRGGDCGWIARKGRDLPEPVLEAAWALPQGGVSDVVRANDGCYLVKTLGIEPKLEDDAIIARMRESLVEDFTKDMMKRADIRRADGKRLDGDDPTEAGK